MRKLRLLALLSILIAVIAHGSTSHSSVLGETRCDSSNSLGLCTGGQDTGCDAWCQGSEQCSYYGFTNVHGACEFGN